MVSVSFLLIVFFMVTINMAKPKMINYDFGGRRGCGPDAICQMKFELIQFYSIIMINS